MIELRSDTFTLPDAEMRAAMIEAPVGDDVYGEDPSVRRLETRAAELLGKESAMLVPSGTMANLCAILALGQRGDDVLLGNRSDLYLWEAGGMSVLGGLAMNPVATEADGTLALATLQAAVRDPDDSQCAPARFVAIENTHTWLGGRVLPLGYLKALRAFCDTKGLALHIDGARLFNAAEALSRPAAHIAAFADTVQVCLSKGLGAPIGSLLAGTDVVIARARRWRKMLGGGMRQAGLVAAAGLIALEKGRLRLGEDHRTAALFADGIRACPDLSMLHDTVETNIVIFASTRPDLPAAALVDRAREAGVAVAELGEGRLRAVTHRGVSEADVARAAETIVNIAARRAAQWPTRA